MLPEPPDDREALRREREFSAVLLETTGAILAVLDPDGCVLRANRTGLELLGYRLDELEGKPFWQIVVPPDEIGQALALVHDLIASKRPNRTEGHLVTKKGERRLVRWSYDVLLDEAGEVLALLATGIDVTEQRRAEEENGRLLLSERRARAAAERAEQRASFLTKAVHALNTTFEDYPGTLRRIARLFVVPEIAEWCIVRTLQRNDMVATMAFAHADPEIERRVAPLLALELSLADDALALRNGSPVVVDSDPARPGAARESLLAALRGEQRELTARVLADVGLEAYMDVPLRVRGRLIGAMVFGTGREGHRFDPETLALAEALAARAALAIDNARLSEEAHAASQARDEFLVAASHELRTPCTSMALAVHGLIRRAEAGRLGALPVDVQLRVLRRCEEQARKLASLVERLLDVTRIAASPLPLRREKVDLVTLVREVVEQHGAAAARAGSPIQLLAPAPVVGHWDRARLAQALAGILENALKYGASCPVEVRVEAVAAVARVAVEDHGIGIDWRKREQLFQRFGRAAPVERYGGLGLDLYLARVIVEAHSGMLHVQSRAGHGSTFVVTLPRDQELAGPTSKG